MRTRQLSDMLERYSWGEGRQRLGWCYYLGLSSQFCFDKRYLTACRMQQMNNIALSVYKVKLFKFRKMALNEHEEVGFGMVSHSTEYRARIFSDYKTNWVDAHLEMTRATEKVRNKQSRAILAECFEEFAFFTRKFYFIQILNRVWILIAKLG